MPSAKFKKLKVSVISHKFIQLYGSITSQTLMCDEDTNFNTSNRLYVYLFASITILYYISVFRFIKRRFSLEMVSEGHFHSCGNNCNKIHKIE